MTRSEQLELLLTDVCTTGLNCLRNRHKAAARDLLRRSIDQAMAWLKADAAAQRLAREQEAARPEPPAPRLPYADN